MIPKENAKKQGKKLVAEAKRDMESRSKATAHNLNQAILEGVSHEVKQPVTVSGDPVKAFEHRQKNKISCCICGISAGTFFINNGEKFCSQHKDFMYMDKTQRERELAKC